jgi:hypothetical protein
MKRKTMAFRLTLLTFALGLASTASAQLVITQLGTQTLITFDTATPGIYHPRTGTGGTYNIIEPDSWQLDNFNNDKGSGFLSNGVASSYGTLSGYQGQGNNSPTRFANDGNGNGNSTDDNIGFSGMAVYRPDQIPGLNSNAFRLAIDGDWAENGQYFRILNNTGSTVSAWTFTADLFIVEPDADANDFSNIQFAYAVDNGNNPATMPFTPFGGSPTITSGMTLSGTPQFQLNSTVSATVANGGYIVLAFLDTANAPGSTVFVDNIGITAVPEPSTYALIGLGLAALFTLRRFSSKSS